MKKSMIEVAYSLMKKKKGSVAFEKLYKEISEILGFTTLEFDTNISKFYTHLTLDGRFVFLKDSKWDLRERQSFESVAIDMNEVYSELEEVVVEELGEIEPVKKPKSHRIFDEYDNDDVDLSEEDKTNSIDEDSDDDKVLSAYEFDDLNLD